MPSHGVFQLKKLGSYLNLEAHKEMGGNERDGPNKSPELDGGSKLTPSAVSPQNSFEESYFNEVLKR